MEGQYRGEWIHGTTFQDPILIIVLLTEQLLTCIKENFCVRNSINLIQSIMKITTVQQMFQNFKTSL